MHCEAGGTCLGEGRLCLGEVGLCFGKVGECLGEGGLCLGGVNVCFGDVRGRLGEVRLCIDEDAFKFLLCGHDLIRAVGHKPSMVTVFLSPRLSNRKTKDTQKSSEKKVTFISWAIQAVGAWRITSHPAASSCCRGYPIEQNRLLRLLIEGVQLQTGGIEIAWRELGIYDVAAEIAEQPLVKETREKEEVAA